MDAIKYLFLFYYLQFKIVINRFLNMNQNYQVLKLLLLLINFIKQRKNQTISYICIELLFVALSNMWNNRDGFNFQQTNKQSSS